MLILKSTHTAATDELNAQISALHTKLNYANSLINSQAQLVEELMEANYNATLRLAPFRTYHRDALGRFVSVKGK